MNKQSKPKAIGYIRVSSDEQAREGLSLEAQEKKIKAYCELKDLELVSIFKDEGISGFKVLEKRTGGSMALEALGFDVEIFGNKRNNSNQENDFKKPSNSKRLDSGEDVDTLPVTNTPKNAQDLVKTKQLDQTPVTHLVAIKLDRLFRNTGDAIAKSTEFQKRNINLHLLDVSVDTSTATGKMFFTVLAMLAQFERDITGERTKTVLDMKRKEGKVWNHTPYGYDRIGDSLVPNSAEQQAIKRMKAMRKEGYSLRDIAFELELEGFKPKASTHWQAMSVRKVISKD